MGFLVCTQSIRNCGMMQLIFLIQHDSYYLIMYSATTFYSSECVTVTVWLTSHSCLTQITVAISYGLGSSVVTWQNSSLILTKSFNSKLTCNERNSPLKRHGSYYFTKMEACLKALSCADSFKLLIYIAVAICFWFSPYLKTQTERYSKCAYLMANIRYKNE